jgi:hypothetical protein
MQEFCNKEALEEYVTNRLQAMGAPSLQIYRTRYEALKYRGEKVASITGISGFKKEYLPAILATERVAHMLQTSFKKEFPYVSDLSITGESVWIALVTPHLDTRDKLNQGLMAKKREEYGAQLMKPYMELLGFDKLMLCLDDEDVRTGSTLVLAFKALIASIYYCRPVGDLKVHEFAYEVKIIMDGLRARMFRIAEGFFLSVKDREYHEDCLESM